MSFIPLSHPDITEAEVQAVAQALRSGRLTLGPRLSRFEELVADRVGRRHGVAVGSGMAALHLALLALGVGPGDEVIASPFAFVASANAVILAGARPVFVDIDPHSLNIDVAKVEAAITPRTKAILAPATFGSPIGLDRLVQIAQAHELPLVEEGCDGLGSRRRGKSLGQLGRVGVFGFYPGKIITTGEGGMIVTDDDCLARLCRCLRNHGRSDSAAWGLADPQAQCDTRTGARLAHERLGFSYRLDEMSCALGITQMERLDGIIEARRRIVANYMQRLMDYQDLILPNVDEGDEMAWAVFVVRLSDQFGQTERDRIITGLHRHDIGASNFFPCVHLQPYFRQQLGHKSGDFPVAESICQRTIALPLFNAMDATQIELVCLTLKIMLDREHLLKPS